MMVVYLIKKSKVRLLTVEVSVSQSANSANQVDPILPGKGEGLDVIEAIE